MKLCSILVVILFSMTAFAQSSVSGSRQSGVFYDYQTMINKIVDHDQRLNNLEQQVITLQGSNNYLQSKVSELDNRVKYLESLVKPRVIYYQCNITSPRTRVTYSASVTTNQLDAEVQAKASCVRATDSFGRRAETPADCNQNAQCSTFYN